VSKQNRTGTPVCARRYAEFRDASGSWTVKIREYQADINTIIPGDISPDPDPREAYHAAVFLEGFIEGQKNTGNWSDDVLESFESFASTVEFEAVAKVLREIGGRPDQ
jgi:hypothetical protein